jgi:hypothetical protein
VTKLRGFSKSSEDDKKRDFCEALTRDLHYSDGWEWILSHVEKACRMWQDYKDKIKCGQPLPQEYAAALTQMEAALTIQLANQIKDLRELFLIGPTYLHDWQEREDGMWEPRMSTMDAWEKDKLFWCLDKLTATIFESTSLPKSWYINFFEEQMKASNSKAKARVDAELYAYLSDIAAVDEALTALRYHRPQYGYELTFDESKKLTFNTRFTRWYGTLHDSRKECNGQNPQLWEALEHFMKLPVPSNVSDRTSVGQYRKLHDNLKAFWKHVRDEVEKRAGDEGYSKAEREGAIERVSKGLSESHCREIDQEIADLREAMEVRGL